MHIPGHGFLSLPVSASTVLASLAALGLALGKLRSRLTNDFVLRLAAVAALVFAAQMFNFPISKGTSGHLIGAVLAAVILGPWAAMFLMTAVLFVQCALFGDGGYFSLGANIFNMACVAPWVGWIIYRALTGSGAFARYAAIFIGSWASVVVAAGACSFEIALSGTATLGSVLPAMVLTHSSIGAGEGAITVVAFALAARFIPSIQKSEIIRHEV